MMKMFTQFKRPARTTMALAALFMAAAPLTGCYYDKEEELYPSPTTCDISNVRYSTTIKSILGTSCALAGCHNAATPSSGYNFELDADAQRSAQDGSLVGTTTHAAGYPEMPRGSAQLPDCQLSQIKAWVAAGAPNN